MDDFRYAFRSLGRAPGFAALAILTLGLGIGGTTAVFSVVNGVLLTPLPYPDAARIVQVSEADGTSRTRRVSNPDFQDWHAAARSFSAMAGWLGGPSPVLGGSEPVVVGVYLVTRDFFDVFGVAPELGRTFVDEEARLNGAPAVVVSHALWQRVLGGRRDLQGLSLRVDGRSAAVVGVMPPAFAYPPGAELWYPKEVENDTSGRTSHNLQVVARLAPDVSIAQAQAEMSAIAGRLEAEYTDDHDNPDAAVAPLLDRIVGPSRRLLLVLLGAVLLVLLGACVNVASMLLARGAGRRRELAVRVALGAPRERLIRLLLAESVVLSVAGAAVGVFAAVGMVRAVIALAPGQLPRLAEVALDARALGVAMAVAMIAPIVTGLAPALQLSTPTLGDALAESGRGGVAGARSRTRHVLVAVEVALALLLLAGTGLMVRSFSSLLSTNPGVRTDGVVTLETRIPGDRYPDGPSAVRFYDALVERVSAIGGVVDAGVTNAPPLSGSDANGGFLYDGQSFEEIRGNWQAQSASYRVVGGHYFETLGIPVLRGRAFERTDVAGATPVAVINQAMARRYFSDRDPIGRRIRFAGMDRDNPWLTIVGVSGDVRHRLAAEPVPEVYVHYPQLPMRLQYVVTAVARLGPGVTVAQVAPALREAVRALDPDVTVELSTMSALVDQSVADRRFAMVLLAAFGVMALVLVSVGIYGVLAQAVAARAPEVAIRMALGARAGAVAGLVLRGAMGAFLAGVVAGALAAVASTRVLGALLFGVEPTDPITFVAVVALLALVAACAALVPIRRALRVDPVAVLRA